MSSVRKYGPASWGVVWCNESCFKPDNIAQRQSMAMSVRDLDGALFCVRKARHLEKWLEEPKRSEYVLLTNWREVKPCIATLTQCDVTQQPYTVILLCDTPTSLKRAFSWAQQYSKQRVHHMPDVHVCTSLEPIPSFFAALAQHIPGTRVQLQPEKADALEVGSQKSVLSECKGGYGQVSLFQSDEAMEEPFTGSAWQAGRVQGCNWKPANLSPPVAPFFEEPVWKGSDQAQICDHLHSHLQNNAQ